MTVTSELPRPIPGHIWLSARARNAVRRPWFIGAVAAATVGAAIIAVLAWPRHLDRVHETVVTIEERPDTAAIIAGRTQARVRLAAADSALAAARISQPAPAPVDTLTPRLAARRDSLFAEVADLDALLARVESAPLAASFRALAQSRGFAGSARAKALLDSLNAIEQDRDAFGGAGATDPSYLALTARSAEIGRELQMVAQARRDTLRSEISSLTNPAAKRTVAAAPQADTAAWIAERDSAVVMLALADTQLVQARDRLATLSADTPAPPSREDETPFAAVVGAALVFGVVLGFGAAFLGEMRRPRVADEHETERLTGTRVVATVRPRPPIPERVRRLADREAPPYFDPLSDGHQLTYLHVARAGASRLTVAVVGDDTNIAAVVAINFAAIAADEARSTLIIDTDLSRAPVAAALRMRSSPGVTDILEGRTAWPEAVQQVSIGRDRVIDVIPSGTMGKPAPADLVGRVRGEVAKVTRHYDAVIVVASARSGTAEAPLAPIADILVCGRVGQTRISRLNHIGQRIRVSGGNPLGIVLWEGPPPEFADGASAAPPPAERSSAPLTATAGAR